MDQVSHFRFKPEARILRIIKSSYSYNMFTENILLYNIESITDTDRKVSQLANHKKLNKII